MAIEKMILVNIKGPLDRLDDTMIECSDLGCFHPEDITPTGSANTLFEELKYSNPYQGMLSRMVTLAGEVGIKLSYKYLDQLMPDKGRITAFLDRFTMEFESLDSKRRELKENVQQHSNALVHLHRLEGLNLSFDLIFSNQFARVRFGRLPRDSVKKLEYYNNKMFFFVKFEQDDTYLWCAYFTTNEYVDEVDNIFSALFFERVFIPEYVHGTPQAAISQLDAQCETEKKWLEEMEREIEKLRDKHKEAFLLYYRQIKFLCSTFDLRRFVGVSGGTFYMIGFIPKSAEESFSKQLGTVAEISVDLLPGDTDKRFQAPTKLKNNWFARPFEMFVKMYGVPSHKDMDPTPYVAVVYTLLFGIMFGDVGQGLLISLVGMVMYRWKGMELGRIMERIGVSSAVFGLVYGSVFGFENLLDPLYHALGFSSKPVEVLDGATINILLGGAVGIGVLLICISIGVNIVLGLAQRDWERAFFTQNGLAGLVFYGTLLAGILTMFTGHSIFNVFTVSLGVVLPLLVIFFKDPLTRLCRGAKPFHMEDGVGSFVAENGFELFEVALSFVANTLSFLRVGGFILSHAGMMTVVFTISSMVGAAASPVVIILGNLFVMCLEGLIVGIQVLRLQFYEMFSRFFGGEGEPFEPISVDMAAEN